MRTQEDVLRLEAENRHLRDRLNSLGDVTVEMRRGVADLLAPVTRERPELRLAIRLLASEAGLPTLCGRRECRRAGVCRAENIPPACQAHWSEELTARFDYIAVGVELSALCQEQEQAGFHAYACEQLGLTPEKPNKKTRKKGGRKVAVSRSPSFTGREQG